MQTDRRVRGTGMAKPSNPPIFDKDGYVSLDGMTLRDLFAAAAMAGDEANPNTERSYEASADIAYEMADAMLAERERGGE